MRGNRHLRWTIAIAALLVAAGISFVVEFHGQSADGSPTALPGADAKRSSAKPRPAREGAALAPPEARLSSSPSASMHLPMPDLRRLKDANLLDMCGVGKIAATEASLARAQQQIDARVQAALRQSINATASGQDPRARAAGLLAQIAAGRTGAKLAPSAALDELARSAMSSADPAVYGMASAVCNLAGAAAAAGACAGLAPNEWAALDPENGIAWLHVAMKAGARGDSRTESAALERAASRTAWDVYTTSALAFVQPAIPKNLDPLVRYGVVANLTMAGVNVSDFSPYLYLGHYCRDVADPTRRRLCGSIAARLLQDDRTLMGFGMAIGVGERAGWPPAKVAALRLRMKAFNAISWSLESDDDPVDYFSCGAAQLRTGRLEVSSRSGELLPLRSALEQSGVSEAEWAQRLDAKIAESTEKD